MTDNRWSWVTPGGENLIDRGAVVDVSEQKLHINTGAGTTALDLWNPHPSGIPDPPPSETPPGAAGTSVARDATHGDDLTDGAHEQVAAPVASAPGEDLSQAWTLREEPKPDALGQLLADGRRRLVRRRTMRRAAIAAAVAGVAVTVVGIVAAVVWPAAPVESTPPAGAGSVSAWCAVGVSGDVTTVAAGAAVDSPQTAVAAFLSALLDQRSPATARAVMATSAPAPTLDELRTWIAGLPAAQVQWCAQITATDSPARLRVAVTGRVGDDGDPQPMSTDTFYVSAPTPTTWVVDAIVAEEGTQP